MTDKAKRYDNNDEEAKERVIERTGNRIQTKISERRDKDCESCQRET